MIETKPCPVCWGKKYICIGIDSDLKPSMFEPCMACDGTGWIAYKTVGDKETINKYGSGGIS